MEGRDEREAVMAIEGFPSTVRNASYCHHIHRRVWCFVQLYFLVYSKILAIISWWWSKYIVEKLFTTSIYTFSIMHTFVYISICCLFVPLAENSPEER